MTLIFFFDKYYHTDKRGEGWHFLLKFFIYNKMIYSQTIFMLIRRQFSHRQSYSQGTLLFIHPSRCGLSNVYIYNISPMRTTLRLKRLNDIFLFFCIFTHFIFDI